MTNLQEDRVQRLEKAEQVNEVWRMRHDRDGRTSMSKQEARVADLENQVVLLSRRDMRAGQRLEDLENHVELLMKVSKALLNRLIELDRDKVVELEAELITTNEF